MKSTTKFVWLRHIHFDIILHIWGNENNALLSHAVNAMDQRRTQYFLGRIFSLFSIWNVVLLRLAADCMKMTSRNCIANKNSAMNVLASFLRTTYYRLLVSDDV